MVLLALGLCALGCKVLYEKIPVPPGGDTNAPAQVQPNAKVVDTIKTVTGFFGPYGDLIASALSVALYAGARYQNNKLLAQHLATSHPTNPAAPTTGPPG